MQSSVSVLAAVSTQRWVQPLFTEFLNCIVTSIYIIAIIQTEEANVLIQSKTQLSTGKYLL